LDEVRLSAWDRALFTECGDGWLAEEAWRRMAKGYVCGVDQSENRVARANRLRGVPGKLEFRTWDGRHLAMPGGCFDWVVSEFASEPCSGRVLVLEEVRRVLRPGGEVYLLQQQSDPGRGDAELRGLLGDAGFLGVEQLAPQGVGVEPAAVIVRARRSLE
jgi:ubiquinone/menaquinone biosynthesis C-methylase UbiE